MRARARRIRRGRSSRPAACRSCIPPVEGSTGAARHCRRRRLHRRLGPQPGRCTGRSRTPSERLPRRPRSAPSWRSSATALGRRMPVLGICRGMQLLNVALGGDLVQHLDGDTPQGACRGHTPSRRRGDAGYAPGRGAGRRARARTPATIRRPTGSATGLRVASARPRTGRSRRSRIRRARFVVGVLWHPEEDEVRRRAALPRAGRPGDHVPEGGGMSAQRSRASSSAASGSTRPRARRSRSRTRRPQRARERRRGRRRGRRPCRRRGGRRRTQSWGCALAGDARPAHAPLRRARRGARRGAGAARVPQRRHADRRCSRPARDDRRRHPLLRGRRRQVLRSHRPGRAGRRGAHVPRADRCGRA